MGGMGGPDPQFLHGRRTRFRYDNGTESADGIPYTNGGATWLGARDFNQFLPINFGQFRFRWAMTNEDGAESGRSQELWVSRDGGSYAPITDTTNGIRLVDTNAWDGIGEDSTDYNDSATDLYTAAWADVSGNGYLVENGVNFSTGNAAFPSQVRRMETEWSLRLVESQLTVDETIDFRGYSTGAFYADGYDTTPRLTITEAVHDPVEAYVRHRRTNLGRILTR